MARQTEPSANNALGNLLQAMMGRSIVRSENTRAIAVFLSTQERGDILVAAKNICFAHRFSL